MGISSKSAVSCFFMIICLVTEIVDSLRVQSPIPPLSLHRCGFLRYKIPAETFIDEIDGDTRNLQLSLRNSSEGELKENDWVAFDAKNQTLYAVLNSNALQTATVPSAYHFHLIATTKRGESTFDKIELVLLEEWRNTSVAFFVNFVWMAESKPPLPIIQSIFAEKIMEYLKEPLNTIRFTHIVQDGIVYSTGFANCTSQSDSCSLEGIEKVKPKFYTELGIETAFRNAMLPEFHLSYIQISQAATCQLARAPNVQKQFPPITLNPCAQINHSIPHDIFYDEEDGYNLQLSIHAIDGRMPKNETLWLAIDGGYKRLYGVVTEQAIRGQPPNGYNVTVRAYDSQFLWAEAYMILKIAERPLQKYYQFTLHLTAVGDSLLIPLVQQTAIVGIMNLFFNANFANIVSYEKVSNKQLRVRSSICTLPLKCDEASFERIWNQMVTTGNTPRANFSLAFAALFTLTAVTPSKDPICLQALDPPVPVIHPWIVPISSCGGFNIEVPEGLFYDKQDGNLRSLSLELFLGDSKVSTSSWLQLNSTNQVLYGLPTHDDINAYQSAGKSNYKLVATDKSGMNGTVNLQFSIQPIYPSTYNYMIVYSQTGFSNSLEELLAFSRKLNTYLGYFVHSTIGLEKVQYLTATTRRIYYRNCSAVFDSCDTHQVSQINSQLFVPSINAEFKRAMEPNFNIIFMVATNSTISCHINTPPRVLHPVSLIKVSVCGLLTFSIPAATFSDKEDGLTPNLTLSLSDSNNNSLSQNSWLQWQPEKQMVAFVGTVSHAKSQERETFLLTATDKGGLSTQLSIFTSTSGPLDILSECQIQTKFQISQSLSTESNAYIAKMVLATMKAHFGLDSYSKIGLVSVERETTTSIKISWSYCSVSYIHYTYSSTAYHTITNQPDFKGLSLLLRKVFMPGSFHLNSEFKSAFQGLSVVSVIRLFSGACSSFPPVIGLNQSHHTVNVPDVGVTKISIGSEWFYDLEDGTAFDLDLRFMNHLYAEITDFESWVGFEKASKAILISIADKERLQGLSTASFYLRATDSTGKYTELPIKINIMQTAIRTSLYYITFFFVNKVRISYQNDTAFIANTIAGAYSLKSVDDLAFHSFRVDKGFVDSSMFTWSSNEQVTCSSAILQKAKNHQASEIAFNALKEKFLPRLDLQRVAIGTSCNGSNTLPERQLSSIQLNMNMSGVFVYKILHSTFSDAGDGNTKNMRVALLDSQKRNVTTSSWIQLNAATLQLYAIPSITSSLGTSLFYLQGINSQGFSTEVRVNVHVSEEPFTNDCPVTITIRQKIGPEYIVDLSVLNKLLGVISDYYNDREIKMKVLEFRKLSAYKYLLKYSNCSFTFETKDAARKGYDIPFHVTLNELFYRLVKPDGTIQNTFSTYLSSFFEVITVQINYDCIERPPHPTVTRAQSFASTCKEFRAVHSKNMFNDARDGTNLRYSLTYLSGRPLLPSEWIVFDEKAMEVYGMVTEEVKRKAPSLGYSYLFVATDSSGRSANITYSIVIPTPMPYMPIKIILAYTSAINDTIPTADALVEISRKIAGYLDGVSRADEIMIRSVSPGKSITFSHCKLSCTEADYKKTASKLQKVTFSSEPSDQFKLASRGSFIPERVYLVGSHCLPSTKIATIVRKVVAFTLQNICGFVEYEIPDDVFTDSSGRKTKDFILGMDKLGTSMSSLTTAFDFNSGHQLFYGPIVASQIKSQTIYDLEGKHPQSGLTGLTSFILNAPDVLEFKTISKSLCVISATVVTRINPAYRDAYVIKKFMGNVARFLLITLQEVQIISYARDKENPATFTISFANCKWYTWISPNSPADLVSKYTKSRDDTMSMVFENLQENSTYNSNFSSALSPDFNLLNLTVNDWCKKSANKRPVANGSVITLKARACAGFAYQVPVNAFSDEDGNTRNLSLQLTTINGSSLTASDWVSFNTVTQSISGSPTKQAHDVNSGIHKYVLTAKDQFALYATIIVSIEINGSAPGNNAPVINVNNLKVTLPQCGIYRAALPDNFAMDPEDGSLQNLRVEMKMIDGTAIPRNSWIQFDYKTHEVYSLVPERISKSSSFERQYKIVVTDSCGAIATTTILFTTKKSSESYYAHAFKIQNLIKDNSSDLDIQVRFLQLASSYFNEGQNNFRTLSFTELAGEEMYEYTFANCSTSEYVCPTEIKRHLAAQKIFSESTKNMNSFATYISASFRVTSYENQTSYRVSSPPRNISSSSTEIEVSSCGGYEYNISKYFSDEGGLRYEISFQNNSAIPRSYPIQLSLEKLEIIPLGSESAGTHTVRVTAYDKCNQTSFKDITVSIDSPANPPGYQIQFEGEVKAEMSTVHYISEFQTALRSYLKSPSYTIEIERYSHTKNKIVFTWKSCGGVNKRCNKTAIRYLHSQLFTATNITNPALIKCLTGTFSNPKLTEYNHLCNFTSFEPPISGGDLNIVTEICRSVEFRVPVSTFSDKEDGNTRQLSLSLFMENNTQLPHYHWLQFNRLKQTIYGYPRFSPNQTFKRNYTYRLIASDIQGNTVSTSVSVQIRGSTKVTYRLTMYGRVRFNHHGPSIDYELLLLHKLGEFFNDTYMNDISFTLSESSFVFSWSYCRMASAKCDCFYIRHIETLLATIDKLKHAMSPEFELINATSTRDGACKYQKAPQVLLEMTSINVTAGQVFSYAIDDRHFYDHEDGYTKNLTLHLADENNRSVTKTHWIKMSDHRICGLAMLSAFQSSEWVSSLRNTYKLVVSDACGRGVHDSLQIMLNSYRADLSYKVFVYVTDPYFDIVSNCTKMERFTYLVSSYINKSSSDIYIQSIHSDATVMNETSNSSAYTILVWGLQNFTQNCTNQTIELYNEKFSYKNGSINKAFYDYMISDFNVVKVDTNTTACSIGAFMPFNAPSTSDFVFPLWTLIFLASLAFLFILCWLCWVCIPRLCPGCSVGCIHKDIGCFSSLCGKCCMPGGKYASMEEAATPDIEEGVLSNARTAPEPSSDKAGKEVAPDDVEIAAAAEEDGASSVIDEEEMKMDPDAEPALYAAPDYIKENKALEDHLDDSYGEPAPNFTDIGPDAEPAPYATTDYMTENKAPDDHLDDGYGEPAPTYTDIGPDTWPALYTAPVYLTKGPAPGSDLFGNDKETVPDDNQIGTTAVPLPDKAMDGLGSMPHEQKQDSEISGDAQSEEYSSILSSRHEMEEVLSRPFTSDLQEYDFQRNSYSESSYSRQENEQEHPQTFEILPLSQEMAPSPANMPSHGRKLSLPPMPNVFSDHDTISQASRISRTQVVSSTGNHSKRRVLSTNTRRISKDQRGRRKSMTRPVVLVVPRDSVASLTDANFTDMGNDVISTRRSKRRRSSNLALLDHRGYDVRESVTSRRNNQGGMVNQVFLRQPDRSTVPARRVSRVRLLSPEESLSSIEPIELDVIDNNVYPDDHGYETRELRMDGVDFYDSVYQLPSGQIPRVRKASAPVLRIRNADLANYGDGRREQAAQQVFLSERRGSISQQPLMLLVENDNAYKLAAMSSRRQSMGYESDSTDSGYGMHGRRRRYRQRRQHNEVHHGQERNVYNTENGQMRRSRLMRRLSTSNGLHVDTLQGDSIEMWSRDQRNRMINPGYESDSFV